MNPFGWRVAVAVLGTLSVLLLARLVRRMTGSTVLGTIAGFLLAIDGLHLVMSRTALLDLPLSFFLLAAFGALVLDREHGRRRAAARLDDFESTDFGPGLGFRPWRVVAGVLLGAALATKWNALFFVAAFGLLTVWWDVSARRVSGARSPWLGSAHPRRPPAFLSIVPTAIVTYVITVVGVALHQSAATTGRGAARTRRRSSAGSPILCGRCGTTTRRRGASTPG